MAELDAKWHADDDPMAPDTVDSLATTAENCPRVKPSALRRARSRRRRRTGVKRVRVRATTAPVAKPTARISAAAPMAWHSVISAGRTSVKLNDHGRGSSP